MNDKIAIVITKNVGTMYCAYLFSIIGAAGIYGALTNHFELVLIVGAVSGYFLQLVLLPIIIVGQNLMSNNAEKMQKETHDMVKSELQLLHDKLDNKSAK